VVSEQRDALTELVQQHVGTHTGSDKMSVATFVQKAVDSASGYRPSNGLIGKIVRGQSYNVTPELVGAIAAGLSLPRDIVAAAAHLQLIGYEETELEGGAPAALMRRLDAEPGGPERAMAEKWQTETGR
jgi:hypothetical protein